MFKHLEYSDRARAAIKAAKWYRAYRLSRCAVATAGTIEAARRHERRAANCLSFWMEDQEANEFWRELEKAAI